MGLAALVEMRVRAVPAAMVARAESHAIPVPVRRLPVPAALEVRVGMQACPVRA